jgi:hypothetical protein
VADTPLSFFPRFVLAWVCFFRVMLDGVFAREVAKVAHPAELPPVPPARVAMASLPAIPPPAPTETALQLLGLLQREGRLVDFIEQDIATFSDADVGAAARVVHDGCRRAMRASARVEPVRTEEEGTRVTVAVGFEPAEVKLSGNVTGAPPFNGVLRHRGWRAVDFHLPHAVADHDATILAPAEVEL